MIKLFQIYYEDEQKSKLLEDFVPYFNDDKSIFVENQCMYDIRHSSSIKDVSHVGVFSYKLHEKVVSKPTFQSISKCISSNTDADIFSANIQNLWWTQLRKPQPLYFPNQCNMKDLAVPFLRDLADIGAIKLSSIDFWNHVYSNQIYCNFWISKKNIFTDYVDNFLTRVFDLVVSYDTTHFVFTPDKDYPFPPPVEWQESTGYTQYPILTFILERLINIYLQDRELNHLAIL